MPAIDQLLEIMSRLRDPEAGCPWDLKQTYRTIVPYTIEEAYEVADAIEQEDYDELRAELGDLLFQVVFYAQLGKEQGRFDFEQVAQGICDKMIRRHPHVFADAKFDDEAELKAAWEAKKREERRDKARPGEPDSALDGVARALPALARAEKLQKRAARVGFDWPDVQGALDKTREECGEVAEAARSGDSDHLAEELGDLMFALVNVVRLSGLEAEQTLRNANDKFERRFRAMERTLHDAGQVDLTSLDLRELDEAWEAVKASESSS